MRTVIVGAMVSTDGVMQAPGGPEEDPTGGFEFGGWVAPLADVDPVFGEEIGKLFGQPFDLLLGRRTYDIFAAYWPYHEGGPYDDIDRPSWPLLAPRDPFLELAGTISGTAH